ncbi:MAG TPA: DUF2914 domain-containing protein [bacterium (Candidatus Stahlbacteria)]|nr:DUF2914 domain-containing protein [Candidatus Stahlbacteria bacterium]
MSTRNCVLFGLSLFLLLSIQVSRAYSQEDTLRVTDMKFCIAVQDREPIGVDTVFADTVKKVYCFTLIEGAKDTTFITHIWYHGTEKRAEVKLMVGSIRWRTWSSKRIMKEWVGKWRVEVVSAEGKLLRTKEFYIKNQSE